MNCNHPVFEAWLAEQVKDKRINLESPDSNNICSLVSDAFITGHGVGVNEILLDLTKVFEVINYKMVPPKDATDDPFRYFFDFLATNGFVPPVAK